MDESFHFPPLKFAGHRPVSILARKGTNQMPRSLLFCQGLVEGAGRCYTDLFFSAQGSWDASECFFSARAPPDALQSAALNAPFLPVFQGCCVRHSFPAWAFSGAAWSAPSSFLMKLCGVLLPGQGFLQRLHRVLLPFPVPSHYQCFCRGCEERSLPASFHAGCYAVWGVGHYTEGPFHAWALTRLFKG